MHRITAAEIANYNADKYLRRKEMIERMKMNNHIWVQD